MGNGSPYEFYLDLLGQWPTNIALPTLWYCQFHLDSVGCLKSNLSDQLARYESTLGNSGWNISNKSIKTLVSSKLQYSSQNNSGCVFAKQVDLPDELANASHEGLSYGGFMPPITVGDRRPYSNLNVTFLESNLSFVDLILRPWSVLVSYNGFVARSNNSKKNVKCSQADMVLLAKAGPANDLVIRKIYRFYNIAPIHVQSESYSHFPDALKTTPVTFAYDGYTVLG